jgi:hypothetical protein
MAATARQIQAASMLIAQGYTAEGAAAIVGNLSQESGRNLPSAFRTGSLDHGSQGLPQWRLERLTAYENYVKTLHPRETGSAIWQWYGNLALQINYIAIELGKDYPALNRRLRTAGESVDTLTEDVCWQYERPSKVAANLANRKAQAEEVYTALKKLPAKAAGVKAAGSVTSAVIVTAATASAAVHGGVHWGWLAAGASLVALLIGAVYHASQEAATAKAALAIQQAKPGS